MQTKKVSKKGAIELSMTTIIVIVIGVVLLSLGLMWVRGLFEKITILTTGAFEQADQEIRERMGGNERFYVSGQAFDIKVNGDKMISIGIQNLADIGGTSESFTLTKVQSGTNILPELEFIIPGEQKIPLGEKMGIPVIIKAPKTTTPGKTYSYKIIVNKGGSEYDSKVILITVVA